MIADVEALLDLADEQIAEVESIYEATLREHQVSPRLKALIKNVIENYRSALDFVANAAAERHGKTGSAKVYWPYAKIPAEFTKWFDKTMPGVRRNRPDLADAWERFQPYQPGFEWIAALVELANANKHRELTPQTRTETVRREVNGPGGSVSWGPGVTFGSGVSIMGEPVDPRTQRTASTVETIYVDWVFDTPKASALNTLKTIQTGARPMLQELCSLADL
ncbi:MAG TPA: hypothetical protein VIJ70_02060 [Gaiellaceae bacterium]